MAHVPRAPLPLTKEISRSKSVRKTSTISGSVVSLSYTGTSQVTDPTGHLSSLTDNRSTYPAVARTCLILNQFAGSDQATPMHDSLYAKNTSTIFSALTDCVQAHQDRRCRILAAKTLALYARAAYAKIRHSPLLFAVRDGTLHRLEDEVGTDVPVALCTAALEDSDDGVSAAGVEALGILTLSSAAMVGTVVDDELLREVESMVHARPSPYAPSLSDLGDEDPSIPQMEMQSRIYENVLTPRIWRLVRRIRTYHSPTDILRTLPFLTACLVHLVKLTPATTLGMDRILFAKRWIEVDSLGLVNDVVTGILLPSMNNSNNGGLAQAAALSGLRLCNVCPNLPWGPEVCSWAARILVEELSASTVVEHKLASVASLLVAIRGLPLSERVPFMEVVANEVRFLPSTTPVPENVTSPKVKIGKFCRRSARMGLLTELALSILVDGPSDISRAEVLKSFLACPEVTAILTSRRQKKGNRKYASNASATSGAVNDDKTNVVGGKTPNEVSCISHVGEEFVLALCQVTSACGELVFRKDNKNGGSDSSAYTIADRQEWLKAALAILQSCSSCINWRSRVSDQQLAESDNDPRCVFSMLTACQMSYVRLMFECMHAVGWLTPKASVSLYLVPKSTPPSVLILEDLSQAIVSLSNYEVVRVSAQVEKDITTMAEQFLEYKFREGVPSRHIRIALIALFTDHWVQSLASDSNENHNMNDMNARELLTMLSEEVGSLTKALNEGTGDNKVHLNYLDVCVASIENIALMACDYSRRHGSSNGHHNEDFRKDIDEDVSYIVSTATAALEGKNLRETDVLDEADAPGSQPRASMMQICTEAMRRIQSVSTKSYGSSTLSTNASVYSLLVTTAGRDFQRRLSNNSNFSEGPTHNGYADVTRSPFISMDQESTSDQPLDGEEASIQAYFVEYCQQIVKSRIDLSLLSSPLMDVSKTPVRGEKDGISRVKNWLRLSPPPLPLHRRPVMGTPLAARVNWAGAVTTLSGASDPVTLLIAYSMRRCLRYDCELEYKLFVNLRIHNVTAVTIASGLRLDLRVTQQKTAFDVEGEETGEDQVLYCNTAVFKSEVKAGDQVNWELPLENWPIKGFFELHPSVTFREVDAEHVPPKMVALAEEDALEGSKKDDDAATADNSDEGSQGLSVEERTIGIEDDDTMDIILTGDPVQLSPMLGMQPCPLVFFRDRNGDVNTFRFLWHQMPHRMSEMVLYENQFPGKLIGASTDDFGAAVASLSCILVDEHVDALGTATRGWAFVTLTGNHLMCLMYEDVVVHDDGNEIPTSTLHFRADDEALLFSIMGSDATRNVVVTSLTDDKWTCDGQVSGMLGF